MKNGVFLLVALFVTACASPHQSTETRGTPKPAPTLLIDARGVSMPLTDAVKQIAFRPFIPGNQIVSVALIPPLGGTDRRESHGVAIEYASAGDALLLSEWPRMGFEITRSACAPVAYKPDAYLWTTRNGLVMTLQADGAVPRSRIVREVRRLFRAGACRMPR
jgi:hypothetical protein